MLERAAFQPFLRLMPDYTFDEKMEATRKIMQSFSEVGITSLLNPG